jgi:penicillin-binding protein 2
MAEEKRTLTRREAIRFYLLRIVLVLAFLALVVRLWFIQIVRGPEFRDQAENNSLRILSVKPLRGVIYDRHNERVAINAPSFSVVARMVDVPRDETENVARRLSALLQTPAPILMETMSEGLQNPYQPTVLKRDVPRHVAMTIEEENPYLPGISAESRPIREYAQGESNGHILGYIGPIPHERTDFYLNRGYERDDHVGIAGIESIYESELHGNKGQRNVEVNAFGRTIRVLRETPSQPGNNLALGLDLELQNAATQMLQEELDASGAPSGAVVALDVITGAVRALVSLPGYDNNLFAQSISQEDYAALANDPARPLVNQTIGGLYPPASTFKLISLGEWWETQNLDLDQHFECRGSLTLPGGWSFGCWKRSGHGLMNGYEALVHSCDVFFYNLVGGNPYTGFVGIGPDALARAATASGFGQISGIDLPGEQDGLMPTPERKQRLKKEQWFQGDSYNTAIGQGDVLCTPLQLANLSAAIANGGRLMYPRIAAEIRGAEGNLVQSFEPRVARQLPFSAEVLSLMRKAMRDVVVRGTAIRIAANPFGIAGKTGTAEFPGPRDEEGFLPTHALFTGFAPFENPELAFAVVLYDAGEGSEFAAPIADKLTRFYFESARSARQ